MVADAKARLSLDAKPFTDALKDAGENAVDGLNKKMVSLAKVITGAFAVRSIIQFGSDALNAADRIDNLSSRLEFSADKVQTLEVVAKEAGLGFDKFEAAINKLNKAQQEAISGNDNYRKSFAAIGISVNDLAGMTPEVLFDAVTKSMANTNLSAEATAAAFKLLGDEAGPKLLSTLKMIGTEGLDVLAEKYKEFGLILDGDTVKSLDSAEQQLGRFMETMKVGTVELFADAVQKLNSIAISGWGDRVVLAEKGVRLMEEYTAKARQAAEEELRARRLAEAAAIEYADIQKEIVKLEGEHSKLFAAQQEPIARISELKAEEKRITEELNGLSGTGIDNYRDQLKLQNDLLKNRAEQEKLESQINAERERAEKEQAQRQFAIQDALDRYNRTLYAQMEGEDQVVWLKEQIARKQDWINYLAQEGLKGSVDAINADNDLLNLKEELKNKEEELYDKKKKSLGVTEKEIENLKSLRDVFKKLSDDELNEFLDDLQSIYDRLQKMQKLDLDWMDKLSDFRFRGITSGQMRQVGDSIKMLIERLNNLPDVNPRKLNFLEDLDFEFTSISSGQARRLGDALGELIGRINKAPDVNPKFLDFLDKLKNLQGIGPGRWQFEVTVPKGWENGMILEPNFDATLKSIDGSLKTLASLKGVVWA